MHISRDGGRRGVVVSCIFGLFAVLLVVLSLCAYQ